MQNETTIHLVYPPKIIQAISPILASLSEKRASAIRQYLKYRLHYLKVAMG